MSLDRVPGDAELYIGGLWSLRRYAALKKANITHVVSALRLPLDPDLFTSYEHLVVELDDLEDENVLEYFATSNAFIQEGLDGGGGVLVHCAMGKSRSVTLLIAYLLSILPTPSNTPSSILETVRICRPLAEPNPGFMQQLELYHRMGCPSDVSAHPIYQRWLFQQEVEMSNACKRAPENIHFSDQASSDGDAAQGGMEYRCRKCRLSLATSAFLISHDPKAPSVSQPLSKIHTPISSFNSTSLSPQPQCAHLFLNPLSWMGSELEQGKLEGRLECPNAKCKANVGKYAWQGMRCSCGEWVVPGISLARGRVDEAKTRFRPLVMEGATRIGGKM